MNKPLGAWLIILALAIPALAQSVAPDTTRLAVGGRVLAMGKAFVGLADDLPSIYTNPAGLANLKQWALSSMSGTFMEDFSYLNVSGAYPTKYGVLGFGYANAGIAGGYATKIKSGAGTPNPVYEIDYSQPTIGYLNDVMIVSYANLLPVPRLPFELLAGASLKFISSKLSGDGITNGTASGNELDLGFLAKPAPWLSLGSTVQNLLPASLGGKITYASGHYESYPAIWENGLAISLLGDDAALKSFRSQTLKLLLDFDYHPSRGNLPLTYHTGLEWQPMNMLYLRAGIDQDVAGDGTGQSLSAISNFTAGVGLFISNVKFDYAYHQFAGIPGVTNNFFSLSYCPSVSKLKSTTLVPPTPKTIAASPETITRPATREASLAAPSVIKPAANKNAKKIKPAKTKKRKGK